MSAKKPLNKLSRLELVELIYQLRKDNVDLQARCDELEQRAARAESLADAVARRADPQALARIEARLGQLCAARGDASLESPADDERPPSGAHFAAPVPSTYPALPSALASFSAQVAPLDSDIFVGARQGEA